MYRRLLRLYPRDFREEYGDEMSLLFRDRSSEGARLWLHVLGDLAFHAPKEHWSTLKQDLRSAVRRLRRAPTFAATIVGTLALGIGANSVIFSAMDAVLLREAPVADPSTLVDIYTTSGSTLHSRSSYPDYFDLRDSGTFTSLAAYTEVPLTIDANGQPEAVAGELVSGNYFDVLGIRMAAGRAFSADEDRIGLPVRVAVISHALWQRWFNAQTAAIGETIRINTQPYTLVGVAPSGFVGPVLGVATDVWVPTALQPEVDPPSAALRRARGHSAIFDLRSSRGLRMIGRLPDGGSVTEATGAQKSLPVVSRARTRVPTATGGSCSPDLLRAAAPRHDAACPLAACRGGRDGVDGRMRQCREPAALAGGVA
jgi:hypothetical protein